MKTSTKLIAGISTLALAFTVAIAPAFQSSALANTSANNQGIHVNGSGKISVEPDTAIMTLGVESKGETSESTQRKNTIDIKKLIDALKAEGIKKEDIKTQWFNIYPEYDYSTPGDRKQLGFKASHTLEVKVRDLDDVTEIIEVATKAGADNVNNIRYIIEDKEAAINEARTLAIKDARAKADKLAKALGIKVGSVINVSEYSDSGITPLYMENRGAAMMDAKSSTDNVFNPGKVEVRLDVNISYAIN